MPTREKKHALEHMLEEMLAEAREKPRSTRRLQNGLHMEIKVFQNEVTLTIGRLLVYPSRIEWTTVLNNFPYEVVRTEPTMTQRQGFNCFTAKFPTKRETQLKFS